MTPHGVRVRTVRLRLDRNLPGSSQALPGAYSPLIPHPPPRVLRAQGLRKPSAASVSVEIDDKERSSRPRLGSERFRIPLGEQQPAAGRAAREPHLFSTRAGFASRTRFAGIATSLAFASGRPPLRGN